MAARLTLPDAVQGARYVVISLTWPGNLDLTGAAITGTKRRHRSPDVTALDGTFTPDADQSANPGVFTWDYGAGDVGEAGFFLVQLKATFADFDAIIASSWTVHPLLNATAVAGEAVVGVPQGDADFLAAIEASAGGATDGQVLTADGAGGAAFETVAGTGDMIAATYDPAGIAEQLVGLAAVQTLSNKTITGLVIGTDVQAHDAGLDDLAGLAAADGNIPVGNGTNWVAESGATARASLGAASLRPTENEQTGTTYTLVLTDEDKIIQTTSASAVTVTVPPNSSVAFPVGSIVGLEQYGAGTLTVAAGAGVTIRSKDASLSLSGQYASAALRKIGADEWLLVGALA